MKNLKYTLLLLILTLTSCDNRLSNYYNSQAEKLEAEGKYEEAIVLLDKAIKKNPQNLYALINRGVDKSFLEDYEGAIEDYTKIIEIDTNNALAYLNRGKNKARLGDYLAAIEDFNKALKIKKFHNEIGVYFETLRNSSLPFTNNSNVSEFDVDIEEILFARGYARYNIDSLTLAFNDFYFCVQENFEPAKSYGMIGVIYFAYGDMENAYLYLNKARMLGDSDAEEMISKYWK